MTNPFLLISIFVALSLFYYMNGRIRNRKEEQRERLQETRKQWLDSLLALKKNSSSPNDSSTPDIQEENKQPVK